MRDELYPAEMRTLITGGAGYVGSVSVERLLEAGHDVTVLDDLSTGHAASVVEGATLVEGSFGDRDAVATLLRDGSIDAVLHCAAKSLVGESMREPEFYYRHNVVGGVALLDAMRDAGVGRLVFSSTAAVYGVPESTPIPDDAPLRPINPYGETKRTFESAMAWYGSAYGLRSVSLRYFNVAGASEVNGEAHSPETHLIPNALFAVERGTLVTLFGDDYPTPDGTPIRDYMHVLDLADAHLAALEATAPGDPRTDGALVCNLGSGKGFSVREVIDATERVIGKRVPHTMGPRREGDPPVLVAAIDRAADVLGWRPQRPSLEEMIASAWKWQRAKWLKEAWVEPAPKLTGKIQLAEYDPAWPGLFEREAARIRGILGSTILSLDHVGSTSIPGLAAKPIIDILLVIDSPNDESRYVPALEGAGYRLVIREPDWHEHRVFKGPDTNINLHVHPPGDAEIDRMIGFRDHLRTHDDARLEYESEKRRLVEQDWEYTQNYADAKTRIVESILARALERSSG
jgi:UDP-glucose 4-epimerase